MVITSLDNKKIKKYVSLKTAKGRDQEKLFLVEGMHLVMEAYKNNNLIDILLVENTSLSFKCYIVPTYVTEEVIKKVSSLTNYSKVIGVCEIREKKEIKGSKILILDDIQDPGNLGTIIRSACAFNIDTIILSNDTVSIYNEKVIRSTQGMIFHMNIIYDDIEIVISKLKNDGYMIFGTDVKSGIDVRDISVDKYVLIMGNEGHGIRQEIRKLCDKNLFIDMNKKCESLNVGVATSILIYELNRGHYE